MKVTNHATQRFLERVLNVKDYTGADFYKARNKLAEIFANITPGSYARPFAFPGHSKFKVVHRDNVVITIIPKASE